MTVKQTVQILSESGIRPSVQRLAVYQYLCDNPIHPTADVLYNALAPSIPTLSKTTIYNTLKLLEEHYLVQTVTIENDELRYDAEMSKHIHFKCTSCGAVHDIFSSSALEVQNVAQKVLPKGFVLHKAQLNIWGLCKDCDSHYCSPD